jgi:hypothetical protein
MVQTTCEPLSIWSTLTPDLDLAHHNFTIAMHIGIVLFKYVVVPALEDMTILEDDSLEFGQPPSPIGFQMSCLG